MAQTEFQHGRNKRSLQQGTCWSTFAASHILREVPKRALDGGGRGLGSIQPHEAIENRLQRPRRVRKRTALDCYTEYFKEIQRASGNTSFNPIINPVDQLALLTAWNELGADAKAVCFAQAEASPSAADDRALRAAERQLQPLPPLIGPPPLPPPIAAPPPSAVPPAANVDDAGVLIAAGEPIALHKKSTSTS